MFQIAAARFGSIKNDTLSGLTVALALVPEAVAFAFVAHVSPEVGLWAAVIVGLLAAALGGRPGMISGGTGALAVIMAGLVVQHGVDYLFPAVILMGLIQIVVGLLRLGKYMRIVPYPVMLGFVNGLAIVIFLAQLQHFYTIDPVTGEKSLLGATPLMATLLVVILTMVIIHFLPRVTRAVPSALVAIVAATLLTIGLSSAGFEFGIRTVGDIAGISGLPSLPEFGALFADAEKSWETLTIIFPYAFAFAAIGLVESLLTLGVIDEMTDTRGQGNRECIAQGVANCAAGAAGTMGGCAMIGQSLINISNGARARLSGIVAAGALLAFIMFGAPLIERLPMAALTGLMIMVAIGTFEWVSVRIFNKYPKSDILVMVLVTGVTVLLHNLALAVLIGVIIAALVFAWDNAKRIRARKRIDEDGVKHYEIYGPLFFGSIKMFNEKFDVHGDPEEVIIDFRESRIADMSAIEAVNKLTERYHRVNKKVYLTNLPSSSHRLLLKADKVINVNVRG